MSPRQIVTIDSSEPIEKINEIIARDGGVIVANFISPELREECLAASKVPVEFHSNANLSDI